MQQMKVQMKIPVFNSGVSKEIEAECIIQFRKPAVIKKDASMQCGETEVIEEKIEGNKFEQPIFV